MPPARPFTERSATRPVGVVGAGTIGVGWAIVFARAGFEVTLVEPDVARRDAALGEIASRLGALDEMRLLGGEPSARALARVRTAHEVESVAHSEYVQECVPEEESLKRAVLAELDRIVSPETTIASSSSAIPCSILAAELPGRSRCLVAHPANPPYLLPVVELVPAPFTDESAVARAAQLLSEAGMSVVRLHREIEGFVFNRLQGALLREAYCLVRDGVVGVEELDRLVRDGLGRRWSVVGPFETVDLNTRGGIEAHAARMGPAYARMGAERGQQDPWTPDLVQKVARERRSLLPLGSWQDRVEWRDRELMKLERARTGAAIPSDEARVADRLEIAALLYRYCRMLDAMELDLVETLFTRDCVVEYGPDERMRSRGVEHLRASLERLHRFARTSHHVTNVEVVFTGPRTAHGRSYVLAWHQEPDGRCRTLYGEYRDCFVRTPEGWRIAERRQFTHGSDVPWDLPLTTAERKTTPTSPTHERVSE